MINGCEGRDARRSPKLRVRQDNRIHAWWLYRVGRRSKIKEETQGGGSGGSVGSLDARRIDYSGHKRERGQNRTESKGAGTKRTED